MSQGDQNGASKIENATGFERYAISVLKDQGYRITTPRVEVIRTLARTQRALNAYAIHTEIVSTGGKIDVVSVYRILSTLKEANLVYQLSVTEGYFPRMSSKGEMLIGYEPNTGTIQLIPLEDDQVQGIRRLVESKGHKAKTVQIEVVLEA